MIKTAEHNIELEVKKWTKGDVVRVYIAEAGRYGRQFGFYDVAQGKYVWASKGDFGHLIPEIRAAVDPIIEKHFGMKGGAV